MSESPLLSTVLCSLLFELGDGGGTSLRRTESREGGGVCFGSGGLSKERLLRPKGVRIWPRVGTTWTGGCLGNTIVLGVHVASEETGRARSYPTY